MTLQADLPESALLQTVLDAFAADSPESALMRTLLDAFAQYEPAVIGTRVKAANAVKRAPK